MPQQSDALAFADPRAVIADALAALLPAEPIGVGAFAEQHRAILNPGGYSGAFTFEPVPYLRGPHDALIDRRFDTVALVGPGQSAKTTTAENWLLHTVCVKPAKMLWFMQDDKAVEAYVKDVIDPMINGHDMLRSRLGLRPVDDSLHYKRFRGMSVELLSATKGNLISKKGARIIADEIDAWKAELGNPLDLLDVRRQAQGTDTTIFALSHPDRAGGQAEKDWNAGIMAIYRDSTRCRWWWPCDECREWSSPCPGAERFMELVFDRQGELDAVAASARLLCPCCGALLDDAARIRMNRAGKWAGRGQLVRRDGTIEGDLIAHQVAGYWVVGVMSEFTKDGLGGLARARVAAERLFEAESDATTLKEVICKRWGFPFDPPKPPGALDPEVLAARAEDYDLKVVPEGVRFLTAACDVQKGKFVIQVEGWGRDLERWIVDRFDVVKSRRLDADGDPLPLDPAGFSEDWCVLEEHLLSLVYPLADGSGRFMKIRTAAADSGGEDGVTSNAYAAWRLFRRLRMGARFTLMKGTGAPSAPRVAMSYPDSKRKDHHAGARGEIPVFFVSSLLMGDALANDLQRPAPGPRYIHFSRELPPAFFEEYCAEQRDKNGWSRKGATRNESWDLSKYNHALAILLKGERIDWSRPPPWAAPWDENSEVFLPEMDKDPTTAANAVRERQSLSDILA